MLSRIFPHSIVIPLFCLATLCTGKAQGSYPHENGNTLNHDFYPSQSGPAWHQQQERDGSPSQSWQETSQVPQDYQNDHDPSAHSGCYQSHGRYSFQDEEQRATSPQQSPYREEPTRSHGQFLHTPYSSHKDFQEKPEHHPQSQEQHFASPRHEGQPYSHEASFDSPYAPYPQNQPYRETPHGVYPNGPYQIEEPGYGQGENLTILRAPLGPDHPFPPPCNGSGGYYRNDIDALIASQSCRLSQFGYIHGGYTFGEGIGIRHHYGTLAAVFAPLTPYDDYYPFLDLRAHYSKNNRWAANFGGGLRWRDWAGGFIFGANLYYDYRKTLQNDFNQIGFGLEFFNDYFEMRLNAYFPIGDVMHSENHTHNNYRDSYFAASMMTEVAQKGLDLQLGHTFWQCSYFSLYGEIGGYYFTDARGHRHQNHSHERRYGEKARACLNVGSLLNLQARYFHDHKQHSFWQGVVMLSIPLDFAFGAALRENDKRAFTQPVERNEMIVKRKHWTNNW